MSDDAHPPVRATLFHDFDQRWRAVLHDSDGDEVETILLPPETEGVRSAIRLVRTRLRDRELEIGDLVPVDAEHDTWAGPVLVA